MFSLRSLIILLVVSLGLTFVMAAPVDSPDELEVDAELEKRIPQLCTPQQRATLNQALYRAKANIKQAKFRILDTSLNKPHTRYDRYFGKITPARLTKVKSNILKAEANMNGNYFWDCTCKEDTATLPDVNNPFRIRVCKRFWLSPLDHSTPGAVSQASLIASDIFRFKKTAGVADFTKGITGVDTIAKSNPDKAINNADSYALYAENAA